MPNTFQVPSQLQQSLRPRIYEHPTHPRLGFYNSKAKSFHPFPISRLFTPNAFHVLSTPFLTAIPMPSLTITCITLHTHMFKHHQFSIPVWGSHPYFSFPFVNNSLNPYIPSPFPFPSLDYISQTPIPFNPFKHLSHSLLTPILSFPNSFPNSFPISLSSPSHLPFIFLM